MIGACRADFPTLDQAIHGHPLVYLDSGATTLKPASVIDRLDAFYRTENSNIHRGVHALSQRATQAYEGARRALAEFVGAGDEYTVVFTRGTTEAINLVAYSYGLSNLQPGDQVLISAMEHHSNIVPWQLVCARSGAELAVVPMDDRGVLDQQAYTDLLSARTRIVALCQVSNALGTVNPVQLMTEQAHAVGAKVLIDGAQAVPHGTVNLDALNPDFYALSGHKMYGPTGIGALIARNELLVEMPPWQGGGDMIRTVRFSGSTWAEPPARFEAGTPHIAGVIGLGAAVDYLAAVGPEAIAVHEADLLAYGETALADVPGLRQIGTGPARAAVLSFIIDGIHPHDIGTIVDRSGVAIRTGHHCAQPVMDFFGVPATSRASFGLYNNHSDIDRLVEALHRTCALFG
jgi:cysteine desulfurase / selenocysteine lyase